MDYLAKRLKIRMRQKKFQATVGEGTIGGEKETEKKSI